ncbi:hypothetical protein Lfu02_55170 [Longispora fulva]|nr:hypothetical protein Lfu02_55170 [Longispora fulva]
MVPGPALAPGLIVEERKRNDGGAREWRVLIKNGHGGFITETATKDYVTTPSEESNQARFYAELEEHYASGKPHMSARSIPVTEVVGGMPVIRTYGNPDWPHYRLRTIHSVGHFGNRVLLFLTEHDKWAHYNHWEFAAGDTILAALHADDKAIGT